MPEESLNIADYVEQTAQLIDLPLAPEYRLSVVENFAKIAAIATLVVEFPLPEDLESAPVFEP
ncbi:DUF4089 domain-containing protein [Microcoleus sp. FACHB-53]|nr:DUF4089 domain-containing protein [Microcoleus sp. FACHB-53]MBD2128044.1 DUF4089 domain-containing protein [Microcoleus sp. FACHB-1]